MKVFVSHSSADKLIAEAFIDLLRASLPLSAKDIRCTSVDGYKLPAGTNSDEQLRQEVFEAKAFIALLSPQSIRSMYVMFELGARWGAKRYFAPVMVSGLTPSAIKAPLSAIHAVTGTSEGDVHQLIETLSERLEIESEKPAAYGKALKAFVTASNPDVNIRDGNEESSYEPLVLSKLVHPGLMTPAHNNCVIRGRLFNKSKQKGVIDKLQAYDRNGAHLIVTWSNRIDQYGNPENPCELIGIVDSEDIFVRQNNGEEIEYCKLEVYHSLSDGPLIGVFDEYEDWIDQQSNSAGPKNRDSD
ncbi:MAG: toll/interleukin-1 receptor domain-containing protein [Desulfoprunum sp.]